MVGPVKYADYTRNTGEFLKRIAHRSRLKDAATIVPISPTDRILDYGCGDGALFDQLAGYVPPRNLCGFDPEYLGEMERDDIETFDRAEPLIAAHAGQFDLIFCLEVCEHLNEAALSALLGNLAALGRNGARYVFGVPLETGLSGFAKNLYRTVKGHRQEATVGKALRSLFGLPIAREAWPDGWITSHLGFSRHRLVRTLEGAGFRVESRTYLPWPGLRHVFNNEVYYVCTRDARQWASAAPIGRLAA